MRYGGVWTGDEGGEFGLVLRWVRKGSGSYSLQINAAMLLTGRKGEGTKIFRFGVGPRGT